MTRDAHDHGEPRGAAERERKPNVIDETLHSWAVKRQLVASNPLRGVEKLPDFLADQMNQGHFR